MIHFSFSDIRKMQQNQLEVTSKLVATHGPVVHAKIMRIADFFIISEPSLVREILVKHADDLERDPNTKGVFQRIMGKGVLVAEGDAWRQQRKLMQPAFHMSRIQTYADVMAQYTHDVVESWHTGQVIDVAEMLTALTLRIIARTMYGVDLEEQTQRIGFLMGELSRLGEEELRMSAVPPAWIPTKHNRYQKQVRAELETMLSKIIAERRADPTAYDDLLAMLLQATDEDGNGLSDELLLDECFTLFFAGHETTAAALTWAMHALNQYPEKLALARQEVDDVLQGKPMTFEDLRRLPYLEAVIKETLRLYPPAPGFARAVQTPFSAGDYDFPKRAIIFFNSFETHRREDLFVDAKRFIPERFLDEATTPDRYAYFPFGAGSRICIGNMFAMMEATILLATLLQNADFARVDDAPVVMDPRITLRVRDPLKMQVSLR